MLDNDTDTTSSEGSRSPSPEPEPEPGYVPNLRLLQGLPYKELQSEISRSRVPEDFNPIYPRLTRAIHLVVFNCHPTNQAGEESKAPSDWPCIWPEPDPFSGLATNKLLETWGEHEIGLSAATWLERNARSKKEHTDRTICLSHDAVLAHLTVKLGLLNCPDIRIPRDEQWQIVNWFTTADPVTGIPSAFPPILLSNLFKAVAGGALLAGGAQALQAWLTPYFERFYLHASHADAQFCTDQSDRDLPGDYRFPDRVMELAQFIPMVYRICRTQQVPLRHQGRFLNQAVAAIWQANGLRMRFTSERTLIPTYAQFTECGLRLLRRIIFTAAMSDKSYLWLEKGGETLVPYINVSVLMSVQLLLTKVCL
ncbi:hypothetical protein SISSUDRAFT_566326 [Sistotremastrum suecicum HHB10207 ss-3]|uniref:Uncharacterized protein n=1 Tax=Sistotremastrum suecicum HHB10207 ss-3 TaxID=1314776 RepID=A0A166EUR9_9AGAM|nr:hypothetical protein SISSUDRAFT_566326 [Sistotremastrum suecicum HHB10207 ss-3]